MASIDRKLNMPIPKELDDAIEDWCARRGVSKASAVRSALYAAFVTNGRRDSIVTSPVVPTQLEVDDAIRAVGEVGKVAEQAIGAIGSLVKKVRGE